MGLLSKNVEEFEGIILGGVVVLDRSEGVDERAGLRLPRSNRDVPVFSLVNAQIASWPAENCKQELRVRGKDPALCS